jgi:hypothetical protein
MNNKEYGLLNDDRVALGVGGALKALGPIISRLTKKHDTRLSKNVDLGSPKSTDYFNYEDAARMLEDGDMTIAEANQMLQAAGYPQEDINQFIKAYGKLGEQEPSKEMLKKAEEKFGKPKLTEKEKEIFNVPMTDDEIDDALDKLRGDFAEGGNVDEQMSMLMGPTHTMPDGTVMPGATHGESEMESDEVMEDNYLDFIINEALSEEEEDMLMSKLEQDEELSMLFDKVIEVASEFAGSGPVEGPGTGVSDSIPARLSDGEFVFTAKAVEEIGADNLMAMMKEAEAKADEKRQGKQYGGMLSQQEMMDENRGILYGGKPQQMDTSEEIQKKMLDYPIIR